MNVSKKVNKSLRIYQRGSRGQFREFCYWGSFMKICRESPSLENRTRIWGTSHAYLGMLYCFRPAT